MVNGDLSTSEKLASQNPAVRREGQRELATQTSSEQQTTISKAKDIAGRGYSGTTTYSVVAKETAVAAQRAKPDSFTNLVEKEETTEEITKTSATEQVGTQVYYGTYEAVPTKEYEPTLYGGIKKLSDFFRSKAAKKSFQAEYRSSGKEKAVATVSGLGLSALSGATGTVVYGIKHPVKTGAIVVGTLAAPEVAALYFASEFYRKPELVPKTQYEVAELGGSAAVFAGAVKGAGKIIQPKVEVFTIGETKGAGFQTTEGKGFPIVSYTKTPKVEKLTATRYSPGEFKKVSVKESPVKLPRKIQVGTPKGIYNVKTEYQPITSSESYIFTKTPEQFISEPTEMLVEGRKISPELQKEFAVSGIKALKEVARVESKFTSKEALFKEGTKYLTPEESKTVYYGIGKRKGKVFGSFASRPELKPELRREVGDIEGMFSTPDETILKEHTKGIFTELKRTSPKSKFRILESEPFHIEKFVEGKWQKAVEFKGKGIGEGDIAPEKAFGFNLWASKDFEKMLGTQKAMLRGETKRKAAGAIAIRQDQALGVTHTGRFKDVPDFFRHIETLSESTIKPTPYSEKLLSLKEELGIKYSEESVKFEIKSPKIKTEKSVLPSPRLSPSPSLSPSPRLSPSPSLSPSPRLSPSPSLSPSPRLSPSPSLSPSPRLSPSPSLSPSPRLSPSPSLSPSPRLSPSPSLSPSPRLSPSPSPSPPDVPFIEFSFPAIRSNERVRSKIKDFFSIKQPRDYIPTLRASLINLKAPKGFKKKKRGLTGLEQRPIY